MKTTPNRKTLLDAYMMCRWQRELLVELYPGDTGNLLFPKMITVPLFVPLTAPTQSPFCLPVLAYGSLAFTSAFNARRKLRDHKGLWTVRIVTNWYVLLVVDGCKKYTTLSEADRAQEYVLEDNFGCDENLVAGWYRFQGAAGDRMADKCVPQHH